MGVTDPIKDGQTLTRCGITKRWYLCQCRRRPAAVAARPLLRRSCEINLSAVEPFTEELSESEIKISLSRLFYDLRWVSKDLIDATKNNFGSSSRRVQARDLLKSIFPSRNQEWDGQSLLCKLNHPVRILWGEEDMILPIRYLNGLPGWVAQHRLSKIGHVPQIEAAPLLLRILQADPP